MADRQSTASGKDECIAVDLRLKRYQLAARNQPRFRAAVIPFVALQMLRPAFNVTR